MTPNGWKLRATLIPVGASGRPRRKGIAGCQLGACNCPNATASRPRVEGRNDTTIVWKLHQLAWRCGGSVVVHGMGTNWPKPRSVSLGPACTQFHRNMTCTISDSPVVVMRRPLFSKTFSIDVFSDRTSATNSWSPAARARAARWCTSAVPTPRPWY